MCENCGCSDKGSEYTVINPVHHDHDHFDHGHDHSHPNRISIETDVLQHNNLLAQRNRGYFEAKAITALNLVSSPGSGKTTLLERTIRELRDLKIYVIEGDQQTSLDADRIQATGTPVIQVNTGNGCHLDAGMIHKALKSLNPQEHALLMIENVGNLVCPALFDLGEQYRVVIISVTEGEDKPLKYPNMFQSAQLCLINKTDLLPHVDFDVKKLKEFACRVNPQLQFFEVSAKTGAGFQDWLEWIKEGISLPAGRQGTRDK
jgi:hydrogenase nickel incorporation protein HypB